MKNFIAYKICSGVFTILPLGIKLQHKIENIIKNYQNKLGIEVNAPLIAPTYIFTQSGRTKEFINEMITFLDNKKRELSICPTCEEIFLLSFMYNNIGHSKLPKYIYQISKKIRDEIRPRNNILRCCEFVMKDGYSFAINESQHKHIYTQIRNSYINILQDLHINFDIVIADSHEMLGKYSEEFIHPHTIAECKYIHNNKHKTGIEVGHIFDLGNIYSKNINIKYIDYKNSQQYIYMGSYGLGIYRLMYIVIYNMYHYNIVPKTLILFKFIFIPRINKHIHNNHSHNENNVLILEYNHFTHIVNVLLYNEHAHTYSSKIEICKKMFAQYIVYEQNYSIHIYDVINNTSTEIETYNIRLYLSALL